jgi:hypothetical protein
MHTPSVTISLAIDRLKASRAALLATYALNLGALVCTPMLEASAKGGLKVSTHRVDRGTKARAQRSYPHTGLLWRISRHLAGSSSSMSAAAVLCHLATLLYSAASCFAARMIALQCLFISAIHFSRTCFG